MHWNAVAWCHTSLILLSLLLLFNFSRHLFRLTLKYVNDCHYWLHVSRVQRLQATSLHWRHNDHDGVSNHQPHGCLLNRLFRHRSKKTSKLRVTDLCVGNSPGPVNSPHKGPVTRKCFNLMTSSCSSCFISSTTTDAGSIRCEGIVLLVWGFPW